MIAQPRSEVNMGAALEVAAFERTRWQARMIAADEQRLDIRPAGAGFEDDGELRRYRVASHSRPGRWHAVAVFKPFEGAISARCDCEAGQRPMPCTHMALALATANFFPFEVQRNVELPLAAGFAAGDAVRVTENGRRGVVAEVHRTQLGRHMYLVRGGRGAFVGYYLADELETDAARATPDAREGAGLLLAQANRRAS